MNSDFDPQAPLVVEKYEYENFASYLLGERLDSFRNRYVDQAREHGHTEEIIDIWLDAWDRIDDDQTELAARHARANFAVSGNGRGLCGENIEVTGSVFRDESPTGRASRDIERAGRCAAAVERAHNESRTGVRQPDTLAPALAALRSTDE